MFFVGNWDFPCIPIPWIIWGLNHLSWVFNNDLYYFFQRTVLASHIGESLGITHMNLFNWFLDPDSMLFLLSLICVDSLYSWSSHRTPIPLPSLPTDWVITSCYPWFLEHNLITSSKIEMLFIGKLHSPSFKLTPLLTLLGIPFNELSWA